MAAWLSSGLLSSHAEACPSVLFASELNPRQTGPRNGMRLFAKDPAGKAPGWHAVPLQIDPVNGDGHLVFPEQSFQDKDVESGDFMTFRNETFGRKVDLKKDKLPCRGPTVFELWDQSTLRYAYLTQCGAGTPLVDHGIAVAFDRKGHLLESNTYQYRFNADNYMQFDQINFKNAKGAWDQVAKDSRMVIRADVRNFFNMDFDSDEIESRLEKSRVGPVADLARLSFFLRILFFKIDMSLSTDVAFFSDSGHIPMMVNIPVNSFEYLNPRSGILYTWILGPATAGGKREVSMPALDVGAAAKGWKELAPIGLKNCKGNDCDYRFIVDAGGRRLAMDLGIKKPLVERGFFPMFVDDVAKYKDAMGWDIKLDPGVQRVAMYFEVSGLPKGGHPWDFWLKLGASGGKGGTCPAAVHIVRVPS